MINCVYYTPELRCYRDGKVERLYKTKKEWILCDFKPNGGYYKICVDNKTIKINRLIAFCFLGLDNIIGKDNINQIDHINRIRNDDRVDNLRIVTLQQNAFNKIGKGYRWNKRANKWEARIQVNKKAIPLGCYYTEEEARNAYLKAKEQYHII